MHLGFIVSFFLLLRGGKRLCHCVQRSIDAIGLHESFRELTTRVRSSDERSRRKRYGLSLLHLLDSLFALVLLGKLPNLDC